MNEEALACECAGHFLSEIGDESNALKYFMQSHQLYHKWGASAKVQHVYEFVNRSFDPNNIL